MMDKSDKTGALKRHLTPVALLQLRVKQKGIPHLGMPSLCRNGFSGAFTTWKSGFVMLLRSPLRLRIRLLVDFQL